jgi:hypothetical protein
MRWKCRRLTWRRCLVACCLCIVAPLVAGCGTDNTPTVKVEGKITFNGQPPPAAGKITFAPLEMSGGVQSRPGTAEFDTDGSFKVTTFKAGDGLIPGRYRANINCWRGKPTLETRLSANYVPPTFHPEVAIDQGAGEPVQVAIDVPVTNKPAR